jgi:hypothetical protein
MESHREIGKDGQQLWWREHVFSDLLRAKDCSDLSLEPVLNPVGENAQLKFRFDPEKEIAWYWHDWKRAEILARKVSGEEVTEKRLAPGKSTIELNQLGTTAEIEVLLRDDQGATQGIRCRIATVMPSDDISFDQQDRVLLVKASTGIQSQNLHVIKFQERHEGFRPLGQKTSFHGKRIASISLEGFRRGAVAVFLQNGTHRRLLALRQITGGDLYPGMLDKDEWIKIEQCLNRGNGVQVTNTNTPVRSSWENWLDNWTESSRSRLRVLHQIGGRQLGLDAHTLSSHLQDHPVGFTRSLIYRQFDCEWPKQATYIPLLEEGELLMATGRVFPSLNSFLERPLSLDEKLWAIQRAENLQIAEAMTGAAGRGLPSLRRALHLAEKRAEAIRARNLRNRTARK